MKKTSKILLLVVITMIISFMLFSNSSFADTDLITASTGDEDVVDLDSIDTDKTKNESTDKNDKNGETPKEADKTKNEATPDKISQTGSFTAVTYVVIAGVAILTLSIAATRIKKYNF